MVIVLKDSVSFVNDVSRDLPNFNFIIELNVFAEGTAKLVPLKEENRG